MPASVPAFFRLQNRKYIGWASVAGRCGATGSPIRIAAQSYANSFPQSRQTTYVCVPLRPGVCGNVVLRCEQLNSALKTD